MTCAEAIEAILEAEPSDLEGLGDGALPRHLGQCARCRKVARFVLDQEEVLARNMVESVRAPDLAEILDRSQKATEYWPRRHTLRRLRPAGFSLLPLAAAAVIAALLLGGDPPFPDPPHVAFQEPEGLELQVPEGRDAAVLVTGNPDITVLWFF